MSNDKKIEASVELTRIAADLAISTGTPIGYYRGSVINEIFNDFYDLVNSRGG